MYDCDCALLCVEERPTVRRICDRNASINFLSPSLSLIITNLTNKTGQATQR